jgi:hypothetical protein
LAVCLDLRVDTHLDIAVVVDTENIAGILFTIGGSEDDEGKFGSKAKSTIVEEIRYGLINLAKVIIGHHPNHDTN